MCCGKEEKEEKGSEGELKGSGEGKTSIGNCEKREERVTKE